jgi:hypothetical protein
MVTGISGTSKINLGTWRALRPARMLALSSARSEGVREGGCFAFAGGHNEEEDGFVGVLWAAPADAERVGEDAVEGRRFNDGVDFAAAEADAGGVWSGG